ncbi:MAG: hypothetical protein ABSD76_05215 [Terriglobales bacterium]|jgi:hypothetical protein
MRTIRLALLVFGMSICAAAQDSSQSQPQSPTPTPAPAFGQNAPVLDPENPPVTGLDEPGLELRMASRSFISPALQVSEAADTNGSNAIGGSDLQSITRVLGAFDLQQFWPKSDLFLEYLGGGAFYGNPYQAKQLQAAGLEAVTRWRTGQLTLRDAFSYLPDGSFFIGTYGGAPGLGLASGSMGIGMQGGSLPGTVTNAQFGSIGDIPRLANTAILDAVQALNPRSAITVAGGFSNAHFYDSAECAMPGNTCLINSDQVTLEGGYSHLVSRRDQVGAVYAFQLFQFPQSSGGEIYNHIVNVRWSHTITGRLSLIAGAGPQYTDLEEGGYYKHWSVSARVLLRYKIGHASIIATYEKFTSAGSGFLAGADTQAARLGYKRPLGRTWEFYGDAGFSNNKRIQSLQSTLLGAVNATSYDEGSAGAIFRKHLGRSYDFFAAYRFSEVDFITPGDQPVDLPGSTGRIGLRHEGMVGVEWHPKPTRIE